MNGVPVAAPDLRLPTRGGVFPLSYLTGMLDFLKSHDDRITVITYGDLLWADVDDEAPYLGEYRRWLAARSADTVYVLLQHDVDSSPERTVRVLAEEDRRGLRAVAMVFAHRHDRRLLREEGRIELTEYEIEPDYLRQLCDQRRFEVSYHCNAVERALWDLDLAADLFRSDVAKLRTNFDIRFFSAHGGVPGPDRINNTSIRVPADLRTQVRWVCTGRSAKFDGTYSDGGIKDPRRDIATRDLRDFVRTWQPGKRYRILVHPQYYTDEAQLVPELSHAPWYRSLFEKPDRAWDDVALDLRAST